MHHLSLCPRRGRPISRIVRGCQRPVRFFALLRIKPHAPPLVRAPVNSFGVSVLRPYSPGGVLNALAAALRGGTTLSTHRLRRGLPGYLILFAPHAFAPPASVTDQRVAFATGVPPHLYAFHRYTWIPLSSSALKFPSSNDPPRLSRGLSTSDLRNRLRALYAQ